MPDRQKFYVFAINIFVFFLEIKQETMSYHKAADDASLSLLVIFFQ